MNGSDQGFSYGRMNDLEGPSEERLDCFVVVKNRSHFLLFKNEGGIWSEAIEAQ